MSYKNVKKMWSILCILFGLLVGRQAYAQNRQIIDRYLDYVQVADPIEYKNLKIFPLTLKQELSTQNYVTLDQAYKKNWLTIKELKSASVNTVQVQNNGKEPVFIMTGEIVKGAKQDRMVKQDILLEPNGKWVNVPVYCVEHGRWRHVSPEFKTANQVAPSAVRQAAKMSKSQGAVWSKISLMQKDAGVSSGTGTLTANYEDKDAKKEINLYVKQFDKIPNVSDKTVGVIVTTGNKIVCFDLFANNDLLKNMWKKLIKSYVLDGMAGTKSVVEIRDVVLFIDQVNKSRKSEDATFGLGQLYALESDNAKGSALVDDFSVVHMDFFLGEKTPDVDPYVNFDARRTNRLS